MPPFWLLPLLLLTPLAGEGPVSSPDEASEVLPEDDLLERRGAVIGEILIRTDDVFDLEDPKDDRKLFRLANRFHIVTRPGVVRRQLLFREGDLYSRRRLEESERLLRSNRYLYDARIRPLRCRDNRVDVEVRTRDVWTLTGGIGFSRGGGENTTRFELQDSNFLGLGKDLTLQRLNDVDRTTLMARYRDFQVAGSRVRLEAEYSDLSDGTRRALAVERPFYSLDTRWAAGLGALSEELVDPLYERGEVVDRFRHDRTFFEISGGLSRGLARDTARRWRFGATYARDLFSIAEGFEAPALPDDRLLVYPWIAFEAVEDDYTESVDLDQIHRIEDRHAGRRLFARLGWSSPVFGGDRHRLLYEAAASDGFRPGQGQLLEVTASAAGRWEQAGARNLLVSAVGRYYRRNLGRHLFFARLQVDFARDLDGERQLLLGGDNGLRGYPLRFQDGDRRFLVTLEQRFFTDWYLFRLVRVGGAVFFDAGRSWFAGSSSAASPGVLKDVGLGLRLASTRSGRGRFIHLDVAFPLDGDSSIDGVQWLVTTHETF